MTRNRSLRVAVVTAVAGLAGLAVSAPAMAAPGAGSTAQPAALQTTVDKPPAPMDLRVDAVTDTTVTFHSDNPPLPSQDATCALDVYLYYVYVNGTNIGAGTPARRPASPPACGPTRPTASNFSG
jgi:hypothetical protein